MNRKYMLKLILVIAVFCAVMIFGASFAYADMTLSDSDVTMECYNKYELTCDCNRTVTWSTSDKSILSIEPKLNTCIVMAWKTGTATITAKYGSESVSCKFTVVPLKLKNCKIYGLEDKLYSSVIDYIKYDPRLTEIFEISVVTKGNELPFYFETNEDITGPGTYPVRLLYYGDNLDFEGFNPTLTIKKNDLYDVCFVNFKRLYFAKNLVFTNNALNSFF